MPGTRAEGLAGRGSRRLDGFLENGRFLGLLVLGRLRLFRCGSKCWFTQRYSHQDNPRSILNGCHRKPLANGSRHLNHSGLLHHAAHLHGGRFNLFLVLNSSRDYRNLTPVLFTIPMLYLDRNFSCHVIDDR